MKGIGARMTRWLRAYLNLPLPDEDFTRGLDDPDLTIFRADVVNARLRFLENRMRVIQHR